MASSHVKRRTKSNRKSAGRAFVSSQRKRELLGLVMMVAALLLTLAIVSFDTTQNPFAETDPDQIVLDPSSRPGSNLLGLVGNSVARALVPGFLGYFVLIFAGLLAAWGYIILRGRDHGHLVLITALGSVAAFAGAAMAGWIGFAADSPLLLLTAGQLGTYVASGLAVLLGSAGSFIVLSLILVIITLLFFDLDIQHSVDRVENWAASAAGTVRGWWDDGIAHREEARERKAAESGRRRDARERQSGSTKTEQAESHQPVAAIPIRPSTGSTVNEMFSTRPPVDVAPDSDSGGLPWHATPTADASTEHRPTAPPARTPEGDLSVHVREGYKEERIDRIHRVQEVPREDQVLRYETPSIELLDLADSAEPKVSPAEIEENKRVLLDKLSTYNIDITNVEAIVGPTVTLYELTPAPGVKISRITALEDDLAMAMAARGIRMIAPIPGKSAVGVEIPNRHRELVRLRDVIGIARFQDAKMELPIPIGKSIEGEVFLQDLTKLPHLLIAGATGAGKSVGLNTIIAGLLYACHPSNLKFVMIDPKKIELAQYNRIVDHFIAMPEESDDPIITDFQQALGVLKSCEKEMESRYDLLAGASVRGIRDYNRKLAEGKLNTDEGHRHLPYIVVIVDELADLMMTAGKEIEGPIARLAQMARAVGIHLILATQRPSVDVITGLIKANFPARIAYQVASKIDSRTILDQNGAEGLVGNGDLLFMLGSRMVRLQGPFVADAEVDRITEAIASQRGKGPYILPAIDTDEGGVDEIMGIDDADDLFEEAARIIVRSQQGSVSLLQRKLSVGYTRAARIVDQLEDAGIVGPFKGSKAREVLVMDEMQLDSLLSASREGGIQ
jgi:DNA segregation ATPase FtsK/SpoIIIE, S-DNA-T family